MNKPFFIAEVKTISPYGFKSNYTEQQLFSMALRSDSNVISIHTDPLWGYGESIHRHTTLAHNNGKKVLAKGLHESDEEIDWLLTSAKVDYVLVVGRIPAKKYLSRCILEPITGNQTEEMAKISNKIAGVVMNARDLYTGEILSVGYKYETTGYKCPIIQASGIETVKDIQKWADGYIVGEHLPGFIISKRLQKLYEQQKVR